jgi:hypothetical protein
MVRSACISTPREASPRRIPRNEAAAGPLSERGIVVRVWELGSGDTRDQGENQRQQQGSVVDVL